MDFYIFFSQKCGTTWLESIDKEGEKCFDAVLSGWKVLEIWDLSKNKRFSFIFRKLNGFLQVFLRMCDITWSQSIDKE